MNQVGLWIVEKERALKVPISEFSFEKELEDLIENDPSLIDSGFSIVGRQIRLSSGRLDLLGLDSNGQFTVIEIKRGSLFREAIAQAVDYASEISEMPFKDLKKIINTYLENKRSADSFKSLNERLKINEDEDNVKREIAIKVVGVGKIDSVDRMVNYLSSKGHLAIEAIGFQLFEIDDRKILIRELSEVSSPLISQVAIDSVLFLAKKYGEEFIFTKVIDFANSHNLKIRPYKTSIMVAPPQHGNRCLFTVWAKPNSAKLVQAYIASEAFQEYFSISPEVIGKNGWVMISSDELDKFLDHLNEILLNYSKNN